MNINIAICVGYHFAIVPVELVQHVELYNTGSVVSIDGVNYTIYKAVTYEGSRALDEVLDRPDVQEYSLYDISKKPLNSKEKTFEVSFVRTGVVRITCTPEELESRVDALKTNDIMWSDDFRIVECTRVASNGCSLPYADNSDALIEQMRRVYALDTCHHSYQKNWSSENPDIGHCAIAALMINHYLGYPVFKVKVGNRTHYYNVMFDGTILDATSNQFPHPIDYTDGVKCDVRKMLKVVDTALRFHTMKRRMEKNG